MSETLKLLLLLIQGIEAFLKRQRKYERAKKIYAIRKDPVAEWNRRFPRLPVSTPEQEELPADPTSVTQRDK